MVFNASAVFNEKGGHSITGLNCTDSQRIQDANQKSSEPLKKKGGHSITGLNCTDSQRIQDANQKSSEPLKKKLCAVREKEKALCCKKRLP